MPRFRFRLAAAAVLALLAPGAAGAQQPTLELELEGGAAWQSYNDVEIPNDGTATRFSLSDLAGRGPWPAGRVYLTWNVSERHGLRLLAAPFSLTERGMTDRRIRFAGGAYDPGAPVRATYTFDSYRLSYRYLAHDGDGTRAWVGATAKLRDATIALEGAEGSSRKDDLGFVPLLHLAGEWRFRPDWSLALDADGLAGGPGRAVDAALELGYDWNPEWRVQAGYRTVEGGADVTEVYTFAWLHFATVSLTWRR